MVARTQRRLVLSLLTLAAACQTDDRGEPLGDPLFPEDYRDHYAEVRPCMPSGDHDLNLVRILVDPDARAAYELRTMPFPTGSVVVKEEYEFGDLTCDGELKRITAMGRLAPGTAPQALDWAWQTVDPSGTVIDEDLPRCISCHQGCGQAPDGYQGVCAILE